MATNTAVDVVMPQMGVSVSEGTITKWNKQVGDTIEADETLLEISTDKVDTEVPSPASGVVSEILVQEGETVDVGTVLARIGGEAGASPPAAPERRRRSPRPRPPTRLQAKVRVPRGTRSRSHLRPRPSPPRRAPTTGSRSSHRSSRASPPSTGSTRRRCQAPAPAAG